MNTKVIKVLCGSVAFCLLLVLAPRKSHAINIEAPGNLAVTHDIGCASSSKLINKYTPADLYRGLAACIQNNNFKDGAFLFAIAGVYGRFDTFRVADKSAHQAISVLQMNTLTTLDKAKRDSLSAEVKKFASDPAKLQTTCNKIRKIGSPDYHPRYMIQHGMSAFTGGAANNGLIENFNVKDAWEKALDSYLHCPKK